jgi:hypothetical protein
MPRCKAILHAGLEQQYFAMLTFPPLTKLEVKDTVTFSFSPDRNAANRIPIDEQMVALNQQT